MPLPHEDVRDDKDSLIDRPVEVVNFGLELFADELRGADAPVVHVEWSPSAGGDAGLADMLSRLGV